MSKEETEVEPVEDIKYENFCDFFGIHYKKAMFSLDFGQAIEKPPKIFLRIWMDAPTLKGLSDFLVEQIKEYEEEHGKIK